MPRDYTKAAPAAYQRLPEYKRDDEWIKLLLRSATIAHVAHSAGDQPFITPTNFWYDEAKQRIIFHSNIVGRVRSNLEHNPKICLVASEYGRLLPSNAALEFSIQYRSAMVYGTVSIIDNPEEKRITLYGLIAKYFPNMHPGQEFRPITDKELARTSVYAIQIDSWSGKENWHEQADMIDDWAPLPEHLLNPEGNS